MPADIPPSDVPGSSLQHYNAAADLIDRNLAANPEKITYIDERGSYSFAELGERVHRCANALTEFGLTMEARVMVGLLDTVDFPQCFSAPSKPASCPSPSIRCSRATISTS